MIRTFAIFILACILTSCTTAPPTIKTEQFTVQYTSATVPWLANLYNCAGMNVISAEQRAADFLDLKSASMVIRLGSPGNINGFPYQIGMDDLLVVVASKNPTRTLNAEQTRELFSGQIRNWKTIDGNDAPVQVWVFPNGEDIQGLFEQTVLEGSPVFSGAYLAANLEEMVQAVGRDVSAIGIIAGRWKTGNLTSVYKAASNLPILAISLSKPQGTLADILACMQK
ncbi:MAG: substrate-binding domain-containing protein [Anaerolineales bacterium]|jgi:hypothetical protein